MNAALENQDEKMMLLESRMHFFLINFDFKSKW